jgi:hypothetical protein
MDNRTSGASDWALSPTEIRALLDGASRVLIAFGTSLFLFPITSRAVAAIYYLIRNAIA